MTHAFAQRTGRLPMRADSLGPGLAPAEALAGQDAVVHLLGEPIAQRWSEQAKREIEESRVLGTATTWGWAARRRAAAARARVAVGGGLVRPGRGDEALDESVPAGSDFLADIVNAWEAEARAAEDLGMRVVLTRTGVVLAEQGGALEKMLPPFKLGIGGPVAGGRQYVPWVHLDDVVGAILSRSTTTPHPGR